MSDNTEQQAPDVKPCVTGCGFFGSAQTSYMCSKCFKDAAGVTRATIEAPAPARPAPTPSLPVPPAPTAAPPAVPVAMPSTPIKEAATSEPSPDAQAAEGSAAEAAPMDVATPAKKKNRCGSCNKKLGFTAIECRCGLSFCGVHRYPEQHQCTFDFKAHDRENLAKVVMGGGEFSKIDRV